MESKNFESSCDTLKEDLSKYQNHLRLLVTMAQDRTRKTHGIRALLYMKSDIAKEKMKNFITGLQNQITTFAYKFEHDIDNFVVHKETELQTRNEGLIKKIQMCEDIINNISSVLADETKCSNMGRDIVKTCERLFDIGFDCIDVDDFHYFSFMPLAHSVLKPEDFGYIKFCDVDLDLVDVMSDVFADMKMKAICNMEESILILTNQRYNKEVINYLTVQITDPEGQNISATVEDNQNGSYFANYVPAIIGVHSLRVKIFNVDIKGSPFQIDVTANSKEMSGLKMESGRGCLVNRVPEISTKEFEVENTNNNNDQLTTVKESYTPGGTFDKILNEFKLPSYCKAEPYATDGSHTDMGGIDSHNLQIVSSGQSQQLDSSKLPALASSNNDSFSYEDTKVIFKSDSYNETNSQMFSSYEPISYSESNSVPVTKVELSESDNNNKSSLDDENECSSLQKVRNRELQSSFSCIVGEYFSLGITTVKTEFVGKIGQAGNQNDCLSYPIGVTANIEGEVIVCDTRHNAVKVFSADGHYKMTIPGEKNVSFNRPSAIVVNNKSEIFVKDDRCIHVFDKDGNILRQIGAGVVERPYGLSFNKDGHLVLFDHGRHQPTLCLFTQDGQLLERSPFRPLMELKSKSGSKCRFLECVDEFVFVVDLGKSVVHVSDQHGGTVGTFGNFGKQIGEFNEPSGITKDSSGMLLIADSRNNRIQIFSPDGAVFGVVDLAKEIVRPSDIHLSSDGYLYITNYLQHCVKVYKLVLPQ